MTAYARQVVHPDVGYYKIVATNGHGKGQELYYDSKASKKDLKWKNNGTVWYISKGYYTDSYNIRLADDTSYYIVINELYVHNDAIPKVLKNDGTIYTNYEAYFFRESGSNDYENLTISIYDWAGYSYDCKLNRHNMVFANDYVNIRKDNDTANKLWKLVPVNYAQKLSTAAPYVTAQKNGKITVNWKKIRNKIKNSKVWKNAKYIELQYSTDKDFVKNVKMKKIKKGSVNRAKAKSALTKLKRKKTYYIRARLIDAKGVCSNWSKTVKIKSKK